MPDEPRADFTFSRRKGSFLVSSDFSRSVVIKAREFRAFAGGRLPSGRAGKALVSGGFRGNSLDFSALMPGHYAALLKGWSGPRVHLVSVTGKCDHSCLYCAAGASAGPAGGEMTPETAAETADFIFGVPAGEVMIEFQGGEPLSNFRAVRAVTEAALARNRKAGKKLNFSLVSSLSLLTRGKLEYLRARNITVCTSLDGPAFIHDKNRVLPGGSSHAAAVRGIEAVNAMAHNSHGFEPVNAVCTVTRGSLPYPEKIVDEFLLRGIKRVQLGPLEPFGRARGKWAALGCAAPDFLVFYSKALDHMLNLNRGGVEVYEKGALMFIKHILGGSRPRYQNLDLLNRLAYGWDGSVYGSDEARLLAESGDGFFRLGGVKEDSFGDIAARPLARALILSCFPRLTQPRCARCPFSAYCRVSPVYNYCAQKSFWGDMMTSERCRMFRGVFDIIFRKLERPEELRVLRGWAERYD